MNPTHMELNKTSFLSNLARTIPLPDFNQSPRNMYQCQMGKQTMATPTHTWHLNSESKMYRLQTPTSPLFRPYHYDAIDLDQYAMGTNAIVAVISYTGNYVFQIVHIRLVHKNLCIPVFLDFELINEFV